MPRFGKETLENIINNIKTLEGLSKDVEVSRWFGRQDNYISLCRRNCSLDLRFLLEKCEEKGWRFEDLKKKELPDFEKKDVNDEKIEEKKLGTPPPYEPSHAYEVRGFITAKELYEMGISAGELKGNLERLEREHDKLEKRHNKLLEGVSGALKDYAATYGGHEFSKMATEPADNPTEHG